MNNHPSSFEEEFSEKEKEVTDQVIRVISVAKEEKQQLDNEANIDNIVEACKSAFLKTREFQAAMQGNPS